MTIGILPGCDTYVHSWICQTFSIASLPINRAFGVLEDGRLIGGFLFSNYNKFDVEFSYYGDGNATAGIVRYACQVALDEFNVERVTVHIRRSNKSVYRFLVKLGARYEGNLHRYYGREDNSDNTAVRLALFREDLERIMRRKKVN